MNWGRIFLVIIAVVIILVGIVVIHHYIHERHTPQVHVQSQIQVSSGIQPLPTITQSSISGWTTYISSTSAYTFKYPAAWTVNRNKTSVYDDITILPYHSFQAVIRIQDAVSSKPGRAYFSTPRPNFTITGKNIEFGSVSAQEYDASYTQSGTNQKNTDVEITFTQNNRDYDIQLLDYKDKNIFYNILNTFTFANPK